MRRSPRYNFEWDPKKARSNLTKHGVSFEEAAEIFLDRHAVSLFDEGHSELQERWITLGEARTGRLLVVVHTFEDSTSDAYRVRIISARRATKRERNMYKESP